MFWFTLISLRPLSVELVYYHSKFTDSESGESNHYRGRSGLLSTDEYDKKKNSYCLVFLISEKNIVYSKNDSEQRVQFIIDMYLNKCTIWWKQ